LAQRRNFYLENIVLVCLRPLGIKPITLNFQACGFIREQALLGVEFIKMIVSADRHKSVPIFYTSECSGKARLGAWEIAARYQHNQALAWHSTRLTSERSEITSRRPCLIDESANSVNELCCRPFYTLAAEACVRSHIV
jgi:hypothetical protein